MPVSIHKLSQRQRVFDEMLKEAIKRLDAFEKEQVKLRSAAFKFMTKGQDE